MKAGILRRLREAQDYISGQQLCEEFEVSRTAIWKVIHQLKEEGYHVDAVRNKGYRIIAYPDSMSAEAVGSRLTTKWAGSSIAYFEEIDSTNSYAKKLGEQGSSHGTLVIAERQDSGKGRRGRTWESPAGGNIYMTILLRPEIEPGKAPMLTLVMAHSVAVAIRRQIGLEAQIKWPNDIIVGKKKVCGILTEMSAEIDYINHVIIGVGINTNIENIPEGLLEKATSLAREAGKQIERDALAAEIMNQFERDYEWFMETCDLSQISKEYNEMLVNAGKEVRIHENNAEYQALALGINNNGELVIEKEDGSKAEIFAGEVSVRGIYGYV
ncbi:biotin--[acetyl-CoA-carboxylase] ligase [Lachnospiraceae bacterium OttesenSCG-928-E19]|nr:biotin--[acetyl-CoA-carboxylase] ligase [Lachnospiraceae bacterium OttesenSCG-928-E19]